MFDCIVIGDVTIDTFLVINKAHLQCNVKGEDCEICFDFGAKIPIEESHQSIGGNAANVASALTHLGCEVALVSELGDDLNGHTALDLITSLGVDTSMVKLLKGRDTRYSVIANYQTDRTIFAYQAPRSYTLPRFPKAEWIYYTSLSASFEPVQEKLLSRLKKNPTVRLAVNPGSYQIHSGIRTFKKVLPHTEILFVNKEEAEMLTGKKTDIPETIQALHTMGVNTVVITDGEKGSYASNSQTTLHLGVYKGNGISKTGAGDAYASAFLAAYMADADLGTCMQWGNANAYGVIQHMGAQVGQLTEPEIMKIIRQYNKTIPKPL